MVGETFGNPGEQGGEDIRRDQELGQQAIEQAERQKEAQELARSMSQIDVVRRLQPYYDAHGIHDIGKRMGESFEILNGTASDELVQAFLQGSEDRGVNPEEPEEQPEEEQPVNAELKQEADKLIGEQSPEEYLTAYRADIEKLRAEMVAERKGLVFATDEAREYAERRREDAARTLENMEHKYSVVQQVYPNAGEPLPSDEGTPEVEEDAEEDPTKASELEMNEADVDNLSVEDAIARLVAAGLSPDEAKALKEKLAKQPEPEPEDGANPETGTPSDEDVANAAKLAGEPYQSVIVKKADPVKYPETPQEMRDAKKALADESVEGRFDKYDEELQQMQRKADFDDAREKAKIAEKEKRIAEIKEKSRGRLPFRKWFAQHKRETFTAIFTALATAGIMAGAWLSNANTVEASAMPSRATTGVDAVMNAGDIATSILDTTSDAEGSASETEVMMEEAEKVYEGNANFSEEEALGRGEQLFAGFMDRENSEMMENGLLSNYDIFHAEGKERKNSWSVGFEDKVFDENGNLLPDANEITAREIINTLRDEPQALASFTAAYPGVLQRCGVDESIISEQNVEKRAKLLMDLLLGDGGGDLQKKLLGGMDLALNDKNTEYNFYRNYDTGRSFYFKQTDPEAGAAGYEIGTDAIKRNGAWYAMITVTYAMLTSGDSGSDSSEDSGVAAGGSDGGAAHLGCGGQIELDVETYKLALPDEAEIISYAVVPFEDGEAVYTFDTNPDDDTPDEDTPDDEKPDDEDPEDEDPEDEDPDDEDPEEEEPEEEDPEEEVEEKDGDDLQDKVDEGGQTQIVDESDDIGDETDEGITDVSDDNSNGMIGEQEGGLSQSAEDAAAAAAAQAAAEAAEAASSMSDEQLADFMSSLTSNGS